MKIFKQFLILVATLTMAIGIFTVNASAAQKYTITENATINVLTTK